MARVKRQTANTGAVSFNMTPMIDIVFNLLIFFILTSQFVQLDIEPVTLPLSIASVPKDITEFRNVVINIVNPDAPAVKVGGRTVDHQVREDENELTQLLKRRKADLAPGETMNVILRADAMIAYEEVARVMLAVGRAQIQGWWITTEIEDLDKKPR